MAAISVQPVLEVVVDYDESGILRCDVGFGMALPPTRTRGLAGASRLRACDRVATGLLGEVQRAVGRSARQADTAREIRDPDAHGHGRAAAGRACHGSCDPVSDPGSVGAGGGGEQYDELVATEPGCEFFAPDRSQ